MNRLPYLPHPVRQCISAGERVSNFAQRPPARYFRRANRIGKELLPASGQFFNLDQQSKQQILGLVVRAGKFV